MARNEDAPVRIHPVVDLTDRTPIDLGALLGCIDGDGNMIDLSCVSPDTKIVKISLVGSPVEPLTREPRIIGRATRRDGGWEIERF